MPVMIGVGGTAGVGLGQWAGRVHDWRPRASSTAAYFDDFYAFGGLSPNGRLPLKHPASSSQGWSLTLGTMQMVNGHLEGVHAISGNGNTAILIMDYGEDDADIRLEFEFPNSGTSRIASIVLRYLDNTNFWMAQADGSSGTFRIIQVATTQTNRATSTYTFSTGVRYSMRATVSGSDFTATLNTVSGGVDTPVTLNSGVLNPLTHTAVTPNTGRNKHGLRLVNTIGSTGVSVYKFEGDPSPTPADVTVTVAAESSATSRMVPAVSLISSPALWFGAGWDNAAAALGDIVGAYKVHIHPFGMSDPWASNSSGPTESNPSLWDTGNRLPVGLARIRECDADDPIILTLFTGSWWMKHTLSNNTITDLTQSDQFSSGGRIKPDRIDEWLIMVDEAVQLAAAEGCRDFEIWNEAKGFDDVYPHVGQTWDISMNDGTDPNHPVMGFGYLYKQTATQIVATMTALDITRDQYRIGGPYPVLASQGTLFPSQAVPATNPLYAYGPQWGYAEKTSVNFTNAFLDLVAAGTIPADLWDYLLLDISTYCKDGTYPSTDPFDYTEKFDHHLTYWRSQMDAKGLDADKIIDFAEIYAFPPPALQTDLTIQTALRAALWADCLKWCVLRRVRYPIMWGPIAEAQGTNFAYGGLISDPRTSSESGTIQRVGEVTQYFKDNFPPGTEVYELVVSDTRISGLASATKAIVYNKTNTALNADVEGVRYSFTSFETKSITL